MENLSKNKQSLPQNYKKYYLLKTLVLMTKKIKKRTKSVPSTLIKGQRVSITGDQKNSLIAPKILDLSQFLRDKLYKRGHQRLSIHYIDSRKAFGVK